MDSLPREILLDILSRLPTTSLHNVKLVCKSWRNLAQHPVLIDMHFARLPDENNSCLILHSDYPTQNQLYALHFYGHNGNAGIVRSICVPEMMPEFDVIGSCNGWICLCDSSDKSTFYLYNPFTGDCTELPKSASNSDKWVSFEFGFHPTTEEYKVVMVVNGVKNTRGVVYRCGMPSQSEVQVLTVGDPGWRNFGQIHYRLNQRSSNSQALINGRLHWVSWWPNRRGLSNYGIVSFDLEDERFREVKTPDTSGFHLRDLAVLSGCLSAAVYYNSVFEIWIMKDYGVQQSWVKEFRIENNNMLRGLEQDLERDFSNSRFYSKTSTIRGLCRLKNGEILLEYNHRSLVSYDLKYRTFKDITVLGMPKLFEAGFHMGNHNPTYRCSN